MENKQRPKMVHVVEAFGGGVYSFLVDLLNNIIDDYDITVIYALREQTPPNFLEDFDPRIKFIKSKYMQRSIGINDLKALFEIRKLINSINPEIVHCHSSKAGLLTRVGINTKKYKTFYTPHGYSFLMQDCSKVKRFIYKMIEKIGTYNHSTVIACSKGEYEESLKLTKRALYVSNGVNLNIIKPYIPIEPKDIDVKNLKIFICARITYARNPKLFNKIAEAFPKITFYWIGDGELKNDITSKNIIVTGWKNKNEIFKMINELDIFLLPSLWEGLPIALLESMTLKKVCIVSNVVGNRDVIKNGKNGFICDNYNEFIKTIQDIEKRKYNLSEIAKNAYNSVLEEYNTEVMCNRYKKIYLDK